MMLKKILEKKLNIYLEGGKSSIGVESTIIDLRKKPKILRLGGLDIKNIQKILNKKIKIKNNPSKISVTWSIKSFIIHLVFQ